MSGRPCRAPECPRVSHRPDGWCIPCARDRGKMKPMRPAQEARDALDILAAQGWKMTVIEEATGVSTAAIKLIRNSQTSRSHADVVRALRILTTQPLTGVEYIPAWPTQRRVQSLLKAGVSGRRLAREVGVSPSMISKLSNEVGTTVQHGIATAVDATWRKYYSEPVGRPARSARGKWWVPPMWWDDIDDPDEKPGVTHCLDCRSPHTTTTGYCRRCNNRRSQARRDGRLIGLE